MLNKAKKERVSIFILIDALGYSYIQERAFLEDIAVIKKSLKSILGYSCAVIPSILTGRKPSELKKLALFYYSPRTSPFRWTRYFLYWPDFILESRFFRRIVEVISRSLFNYKGYFETYLVPVKFLHLFDLSERTNIYNEGSAGEFNNVFDIWKEKGISYRRFFYNLKDAEIFKRVEKSLEAENIDCYFLYLSEFDSFMHLNCKDKGKVRERIVWYEEKIRSLYRRANKYYQRVNLCVFSDHGMAPVERDFDMGKELNNLGLKMPQDYVVLYDSTMARFWFFNQKAKVLIYKYLSRLEWGRILTEEEMKELGVYFEDSMYGECIFLMNPATIILPSFMGNKKIEGMHGYSPESTWMDACFISNYDPAIQLRNVGDIFSVLVDGGPGTMVSKLRRTREEGCNSYPVGGEYPLPRIKVLYFLNSTVRAGAEEHVLRLIEKLDRTKFEPLLVCPGELINLLKEDLENMGIKYYPVCLRRWRHIKEIRKFLYILKKEKPEIVHTHLFFATRFAAPLAKLAGIPVVVDTAHLREAWRKGIKRAYFIDRFFYQFVDKIIAVSEAVKKYLIEDKNIAGKKIEIIRNGVDLEKFKPCKKKDNGQFNIGVVGRLEPQKGHIYLFKALKLLDSSESEREGLKVRLLIVGEGSLREDLKKTVEELGISDKVEFLGYRTDIPEILKNLDFLVLPSLYEGLPLVALEAQAMAKPLILTDVDGSPEAVIPGETGILVPSGDVLVLKEAINLLIKDRELILRMGEAGRKYVEENFALNKQVEKTEELYKRLVFNSKSFKF